MITTSIQTITPERAKGMLASSIGNRNLKQTKVMAYARDMASNKWMQNGESIIFDVNGVLIDGHHRLTAGMKAGVSFSSIVVSGVAPESTKTIDMGSSRTQSDVLTFYGYKSAGNLAAIARILMTLKPGTAKRTHASAQELFEFIELSPGIVEASRESFSIVVPKLRVMVGALLYIATRNGYKWRALSFANVIKTGVPSFDGCPAHALRERFFRDAASGRHMLPIERQLFVIGAWEKFIVGQPVKRLHMASELRVTGYE
jgi:hypothetical protein